MGNNDEKTKDISEVTAAVADATDVKEATVEKTDVPNMDFDEEDDLFTSMLADIEEADALTDIEENIEVSEEVDERNVEDILGSKKAKKKKNKKFKIWQKVLIGIGAVLLAVVLIVGISFLVMRNSGKDSIYNGITSTERPNMALKQEENATEKEIDIDLDNMDQMEDMEGVTGENSTNIADGGQSSNGGETSTNISFENTNDPDNNSNGNGSTSNSGSSSGSTKPTIQPAEDGADYDVVYKGEKYVYNDDMITLLLLGIDKTTKVEPAKDGISGGQSDAIFLVTLNPDTKIMDVIAIPRDSIAKIWVYDKNGNFVQTGKAQICLQHGYGDGMELSNERAVNAISNLMYGIPIHSCTSINMGAVGMLNDAVGGVTLESLETFDYAGYSYVKGQTITLKGNQAYEYLHYRDKSRHNTASERLARQKQYINLFIDKAISAAKEDLGVVTDVYNIIKDYTVTDLSLDEMVYLASEVVTYDFGEIYSLTGTLDTSRKYERFYLDEAALQDLIIKKFYQKVE